MQRNSRKYKGNNLEWYISTNRKNSRRKVKRLRSKEVRRGQREENNKIDGGE
jgi:hypothetical protein